MLTTQFRRIRPLSAVLFVAAMAALGGAARAEGFVNTRAGWLALTTEAKSAYVQGLNDSLNYYFIDDSLVEALAKRGRTRCLIEQNATAAGLAGAITTAYDQPDFASSTPVAVYILKVNELCRPYINRERAQYGLSPQ